MSRRKAAGGGGVPAVMDEEEITSTELALRRGPWTLEEDNLLMSYIACHGEGRWNLLARCSGLKRTGKSCRLRWLNYLKPDIKRGNLAPEEQLLILELHSKWGNRWSRIAQHLPGRTDNEIKNYWRTRVQKQARQLKVDANSAVFRDAVRCYWMPRLLEKMAAAHHHHQHQEPSCLTPQHQQQPHHGGGGGMYSSSSPMISCVQRETTPSVPVPARGAVGSCHQYYATYDPAVVDPSPTSTSTSTAAAPLPPPVPCFSEPNWDQYYPYPGELDGAGNDVFDSALLGSLGLGLGLDGLDLGSSAAAADAECYHHHPAADPTLLEYLNSSCCTASSMTTMMMTGAGAMDGGSSMTARRLGEWGGEI